MTLTIIKAPAANAGSNATICSTGTYTLSGATAGNYASLAWTTSGTGSFNNATILNPVYTPSAADITAGTVTLTLTANANAPCANAVSSMTLSITKTPTANAGGNSTICSSAAYSITTASATNYLSLLWTTSGTGTFNNQTIINPIYTPSAADISAGTVTLTLTANANAPCTNANNSMTLTITKAPVANAGPNGSTCQGTAYTVGGASASNYLTILWTAPGPGVLTNASTLTP
ncbi:MAG: hypothetical protein NTW10_02510, partial [Bacteroidetes bacterium]|nr:hypothetical protein [Bacteroidota bacterium]